MSIADVTETALLRLLFNATAWANYADDASSSPQTNIAIALHTADPTDSGTASSSEATYTSYNRVNVARSALGWTVTGGSVSPVANIDFPTGTGGSGVVNFFSTSKSNGTPPTGAQPILFSGVVSPSITTGDTFIPRLTPSTTLSID